MWRSGLLVLLICTVQLRSVDGFSCNGNLFQDLPHPSYFDETQYGTTGTATTGFALNENKLKVQEFPCLQGSETVYGFQYLRKFADADISVHFFSESGTDIQSEASHTIAAGSTSPDYQFTCLATPIAFAATDGYRVGVAYPDKSQNVPILERVFLPSSAPGLTDAYPCRQQPIDNDVSDIWSLDVDTTSDLSISLAKGTASEKGQLALRPITDVEFKYTCTCAEDSDCNEHDCNMVCASSVCACKTDWIYNSKHNRCVFNGYASGKTVQASDYTGTNTGYLVDGDFSTCITTNPTTTPWVQIDLGSVVDVYAVNLKIPVPTTQSVKITAGGTEAEYYPPGPWISIGGSVTKIVNTGPWPLVISNTGATDTKILNSALSPTGGTYVEADFGPVGQSVDSVGILNYVGYLKQGGNCIIDSGASPNAPTGAPANADNGNCAVFYLTGTPAAATIAKLDDLSQIFFDGLTAGTVAEYQNGASFKFTISASVVSSFDDVVANSFKLTLVSFDAGCVSISDSSLTLVDSGCSDDITFELHPALQDVSSGGYSYTTINANTDTSVTFDETFPFKPCVEIVEAGSDMNQGAFILDVTDPAGVVSVKAVQTTALGAFDGTFAAPIDMTIRATVEGIRDLTISVSETVSSSWTAADYTGKTCTTFSGYPKHGDFNNVFSCDTPMRGRYVAIHATYAAANPISICDIEVHAMNAPGIGALCTTDEDCKCGSDTEDQHIFCNPDSNLCACMEGYHYWLPSTRCVNFDECQEGGGHNCEVTAATGVVSGVCKDTPGNFTCECPDGYEYDTTNGGCKDIDETLLNNCGCQDTCTNKIVDVDVDNMKYLCSCEAAPFASGFVLAGDGHSCEDVDECDDALISTKCDAGLAAGSGRCVNSVGSYSCECPAGWKWNAVGEECVDENRCVPTDCGPGAGAVGDETYTGTCVNHLDAGDWDCECASGYEFIDAATGCRDINECSVTVPGPNTAECNHDCINTFGGYTCSCMDGYRLDDNQATCIDIDECSEDDRDEYTVVDFRCVNDPIYNDPNFATSEPVCNNLPGTYECSCAAGYAFGDGTAANPYGCVNINECNLPNNGGCEGSCEDKIMADDGIMYQCTCPEGYMLNANQHSCDDINECTTTVAEDAHNCAAGSTNVPESDNSDTQALCRNTIGSFECYCPPGWKYNEDDNVCRDVDECDLEKPCEHTCQNNNGGFTCDCELGFDVQADERSCQDVDECAAGTDNCTQVCRNELGTFSCHCNTGYTLDDTDMATCNDVNECDHQNGRCQHECTNTEGSYNCTCKEYYQLMADMHSCEDIDECADEATNDCAQICMNQMNGYKCGCNAGYILNADGLTCDNINECATENNGGCEGGCTDNEGSYECSCADGFEISDNKHSCQDINECEQASCDQICVNTVGSYLCLCDGEYRLTSDQQQCVLGRMLRVNLCYDVPYKDVYAQISAEESRELARDIETHLDETLSGRSEVARDGNVEYQVTRFYPCPVDRLGVDVIAVPRDGLSDGEMAVFAADISNAVPTAPITIDGAEVSLATDPEFVFVDGSSTRTFDVDQPCDYYIETDYCQNEGTCVVVGGLPECRCPGGYRGPRCTETSSLGLTNTEIGLIAGFAALFLILTLLGLGLCAMMRNRNVMPQDPTYFDDQAPSMILADQPNYGYGYGNPYGYGYK